MQKIVDTLNFQGMTVFMLMDGTDTDESLE